jgi:hypothetical protein
MSSGPPPLPSSVRFAYAPCAPTLANWYGQPDYEGCLLTWDPVPDVVGVIAVRSEKALPENCALDLMSGRYQQVAEQVVIKRSVSALVDDQTHERSYYLVLARTAAGEFVAVKNLKAQPLTKQTPKDVVAQAAYWSNPMGRPKGRDPTHLDYLTLRPDDFSGFWWAYPDHVPDLVGYHLIVSEQPIGALTGDPLEVAQFKDVLAGRTSTLLKLEPFVTRLVDNVTPPGRYAYFALLACDSNGGRVQLPMQHTATPFSDDLPLRYAQPHAGALGRHPEEMQQAFVAWRQRMAPALAALSAPPGGPPAAPAAPAGPPWSALRPQRPPRLESYQADPSYWGMALRWDGPAGDAGARFVALRSDRFPPDQVVGPLLSGAMAPPPFCQRVTFAGPVTSLVDVECHQNVWYCVAVLDGNQLRPVANLTEQPLTRPLGADDTSAYWHCLGEPLSNRLPPVAEVEPARRPDAEALALSWGTSDLIDAPAGFEVIHLRRAPQWAQDQAAWAALLRGEDSPLGARYAVPADLQGVRDDLLPIAEVAFVAVLARDARGNRFSLPVYVGGEQGLSWPLLSDPQAKPSASSASSTPPSPTSPRPFDPGVIALPLDANLPNSFTDDEMGLSTMDELTDLGATESADSLADHPLPSVTAELLSAEPSAPADATPPSPVTGITDLPADLPADISEPIPEPIPEPSDIEWQRRAQAWHLTRLPLPDRAPEARCWLLRADAPLPLTWDQVAALTAAGGSVGSGDLAAQGARAYPLPATARVALDNVTPSDGDGYWAFVSVSADGGWSQRALDPSLTPPWPAGLRSREVHLLNPDAAEIDRRVAAELQRARADASLTSTSLERAHTIWPQHTRALAFAHARRDH